MEAEGLHGNELPKTPLHSLAVDEIRERIRRKFETKTTQAAPAVNPTAFTTPLVDEETEAAFAAYLAEPAKEELESPPE
jgi:hypothetical protein